MKRKTQPTTAMKRKTGEQLFTFSQEQPPLQQQILRILAVHMGRMGIVKIQNCLRDQEVGGAPVTTDQLKQVSRLLTELDEQGLVERNTTGTRCPLSLRPLIVLDLLQSGEYQALTELVILKVPVPVGRYSLHSEFTSRDQVLREIQYLLLTDPDIGKIRQIARESESYFFSEKGNICYLEEIIPPCLASDFFQCIPVTQQFFCCQNMLNWDFANFSGSSMTWYNLFLDLCRVWSKSILDHAALIEYVLLRGDCRQAREFLEIGNWPDEWPRSAARGWLAMLEGDIEKALRFFDEALLQYRKKTRKRKAPLEGIYLIFHIMTLVFEGSEQRLQEALVYMQWTEKKITTSVILLTGWQLLLDNQLGRVQDQDKLYLLSMNRFLPDDVHLVKYILKNFPLVWIARDHIGEMTSQLKKICKSGKAAGYLWPAALAAEMLVASGKAPKKYTTLAKELHAGAGTVPLTPLIQEKAEYEVVLKSLIRLTSDQNNAPSDQRLVWWLSSEKHEEIEGQYSLLFIEPRLQKRSKNGRWTKGRAVAMKKLAKNYDQLVGLSAQDHQVCQTISEETESYGWYSTKTVYRFDIQRTLDALVGHPLLFLNGTTTPVEVVRGEPELRIEKTEKGVRLALHPQPNGEKKNGSFVVVRESMTRFILYRFNAEQLKILEILGQGYEVPEKAGRLVRRTADSLSSLLTVHSEVGGGTAAEEVDADSTPYLQLVPWQQGLRAEMLVRPVGVDGPAFVPASGSASVIAEIDGKKVQAERNPGMEKEQADQVVTTCPVLARSAARNYSWEIEEAEQCLELLLQLDRIRDQIVLEWPRGQKFSVQGEAGFDQFSLRMGKAKDAWFSASGKLAVNDELTLDLRELLKKLEERAGRFIRLDDGSFLALTREFEQRLEDLEAYSSRAGKGIRINPLSTLALEELFSRAGKLTGDKTWKQHLRRFEPGDPVPLPSTLQATLRPYQEEGFRWLVTLAGWGVGGCLADDMGLGKTVQALAALLTLAPRGPCLVAAPLSVIANWEDEALRFAPTLNVLPFGPGDRQEMLDNLQPFDLVLCSYGLFGKEDEKLAQVEWQAVILDEGQAIKNRATRRWKAAMQLKAGFRLITTGTPLENHLGELWSLFEFLNPGLLGSYKKFYERFGAIGTESGDRESRDRLRRLIRPFILRRLKSEVLRDLPPRTEITLRIKMSKQEAALYEAARLQALEELEGGDAQAAHLKILARIMQLRRLCCNPALILTGKSPAIESSKLQVFGDTVRELIAGGHKALVFSQFVGHLELIRNSLDKEHVSYQYLDGKTTAAQRKKRIAAFQASEGDLFLISLKAGGAGLNLTAADYVIHMDPWWNPAVEDQASDRAHRIGQQRPVTVYRLVMEGTIEEKIVELHGRKRDLANSLLEGTDISGRMSADELLQLLRENV